ncbi:protein rapunzel-like [Centroberyx affinis]|uniref:protein rapunzel-like n=1 Tax=Centroberyx affinis TaxID=166261 RepID=UPI003A5BCDFC
MVDTEQAKRAGSIVLEGLLKVSSFAENINPLFSIVTFVVKMAKKKVDQDLAIAEKQKVDEAFSHICTTLDKFSMTTQKLRKEIKLIELKVTYGKYEDYIKYQHKSFIEMVEKIKKNPDDSQKHTEDFKEVINRDDLKDSLNAFYHGICGHLSSGSLLELYVDACGGDKNNMETRCFHLIHLFQMGLMVLMAHTVATEGDEDEVKKKWGGRVKQIQDKIDDLLKKGWGLGLLGCGAGGYSRLVQEMQMVLNSLIAAGTKENLRHSNLQRGRMSLWLKVLLISLSSSGQWSSRSPTMSP